jgi:hypothetical protein
VAAEYWGVTLDVVWRRIYNGLVPHKFEEDFVFIDVDPWTPDSKGKLVHEPPPTFVAPGDACELVDGITAEVNDLIAMLPPVAQHTISDDELVALDDAVESEESEDAEVGEDELPDLDEEESATFSRLSWQDVRQQVGRTRRPPPRRD